MSLLYTDRNDLASLKGMTGGAWGGPGLLTCCIFWGDSHNTRPHATPRRMSLILFYYYFCTMSACPNTVNRDTHPYCVT